MTPKQRIARTNTNEQLNQQLKNILCKTKTELSHNKEKCAKSTKSQVQVHSKRVNVKPLSVITKESSYATELPGIYCRPFESRLPTVNETWEIRKEIQKLNDGYYINKPMFFSSK